MSQWYIWAAYLATYGLIVGYAVTLWHRLRQHDRSTDSRP